MIPRDALKQHIAILGKTGSGKTYTARGMVEQLLESSERVCIIDPTGVWWGLKSSSSGKRDGYPVVIFGGEHADVAVGPNHGDAIGEVISTSTTATIIDTSQMRTGERTKFFTDFANTILRKNKGPLHVIIDEAHVFAPQGKVPDPQSGAMLHAANSLVSLGRSRGLRITMITQRPAKLHKDSLTQIETMIAMRLIAPQDRRAVQEWIADQADLDKGKEIIASLASLKTGEGWIWAPELELLKKVKFPTIKTFDSSRAPDAAGAQKVKMAPIDLSTIQGKLEAVEKETAAKDPAKLLQRIRELENQVKHPSNPVPAFSIQQIKQEVEGKCYGRAHADIKKILRKELPKIIIEAFEKVVPMTATEITDRSGSRNEPDNLLRSNKEVKKVREKVATVLPPAPDGELSAPERKIMRSLEFWKSVGDDKPSKSQVGVVAGYSPSSGGFNNVLGKMRSAQLIDYPSPGLVSLVVSIGDAMTPMEATDTILNHVLSGSQRKLVCALRDGSEEMTREELATATEYSVTSGGFNNLIGSLCTLTIFVKSGVGRLKLADWAKEIL